MIRCDALQRAHGLAVVAELRVVVVLHDQASAFHATTRAARAAARRSAPSRWGTGAPASRAPRPRRARRRRARRRRRVARRARSPSARMRSCCVGCDGSSTATRDAPRAEQDAQEHVDALRRALHDDDLLRLGDHAARAAEVVGERLAQRALAARLAVVERRRCSRGARRAALRRASARAGRASRPAWSASGRSAVGAPRRRLAAGDAPDARPPRRPAPRARGSTRKPCASSWPYASLTTPRETPSACARARDEGSRTPSRNAPARIASRSVRSSAARSVSPWRGSSVSHLASSTSTPLDLHIRPAGWQPAGSVSRPCWSPIVELRQLRAPSGAARRADRALRPRARRDAGGGRDEGDRPVSRPRRPGPVRVAPRLPRHGVARAEPRRFLRRPVWKEHRRRRTRR